MARELAGNRALRPGDGLRPPLPRASGTQPGIMAVGGPGVGWVRLVELLQHGPDRTELTVYGHYNKYEQTVPTLPDPIHTTVPDSSNTCGSQ